MYKYRLRVHVQLKDLLEQRKAELTSSYERLLQHVTATKTQVQLQTFRACDRHLAASCQCVIGSYQLV